MQRPGRLVEVQTDDGLRLNGFWQLTSEELACDQSSRRFAWIVVHGVAGNFYNSSLLASISESLLDLGHDTLRINTRGRDPIAYLATPAGNTRIGAAYEMIADSRLDLMAWHVWLRSQGYSRIGLLGHSLGAIKAALVASEALANAIDALVCVSPPRLAPEILRSDRKYAQRYLEDLENARELTADGKPETLLSIRFPQPMLISAATFLDKYGRDDPYDYIKMAERINQPSLWCFGLEEIEGPRASFRHCDKALQSVIEGTDNHTLRVIPNADHAYTRARSELNATVSEWVAKKI